MQRLDTACYNINLEHHVLRKKRLKFTQKYRLSPYSTFSGHLHISHPPSAEKKNADKQQKTRESYLKHKKNIVLLKTLS